MEGVSFSIARLFQLQVFIFSSIVSLCRCCVAGDRVGLRTGRLNKGAIDGVHCATGDTSILVADLTRAAQQRTKPTKTARRGKRGLLCIWNSNTRYDKLPLTPFFRMSALLYIECHRRV